MFSPPDMTLKPSRMPLMALAVLHGLVIWAIRLTGLSITVKGFMIALVCLSLAWQDRKYREFDTHSGVRGVRVNSKQALWLETATGNVQQGEIESAWLGPGMGAAVIRSGGKIYRLVGMPDSADGDALRRWRVWLTWKRFA